MKVRAIPTKDSEPPPDQLVIKGGKLLAVDGTRPDFKALKSGKYNLLPRADFIRLKDDAWMVRHWAC